MESKLVLSDKILKAHIHFDPAFSFLPIAHSNRFLNVHINIRFTKVFIAALFMVANRLAAI